MSSGSGHAIILAGGRGRRMAPYTSILPKPLLPIGEIPILEVLVRQLRAAGIGRIHLAVGYLSELIESYFGDGAKLGVSIEYYREPEPLGTAGPVRFVLENWKNLDPVPDQFLVMNGDLLMDIAFSELLGRHEPGGLTILVAEKQVKMDLGVLEIGGDGTVQAYIEKPTNTYQVSSGVYVFSRDIVEHIPPGRAYDLPDLVKSLIPLSTPVRPVRVDEVGSIWLDLGRPEDYEEGRRLFEEAPDRFLPGSSNSDG